MDGDGPPPHADRSRERDGPPPRTNHGSEPTRMDPRPALTSTVTWTDPALRLLSPALTPQVCSAACISSCALWSYSHNMLTAPHSVPPRLSPPRTQGMRPTLCLHNFHSLTHQMSPECLLGFRPFQTGRLPVNKTTPDSRIPESHQVGRCYQNHTECVDKSDLKQKVAGRAWGKGRGPAAGENPRPP